MELFSIATIEIAGAAGFTVLIGFLTASQILARQRRKSAQVNKIPETPDGSARLKSPITDDESEVISRKLIHDIETVYAAQTDRKSDWN